ncbi:unnamed protein product [Adineta steineri]|uniref:Uncharacterized protein n=1 Tax=Adineta steineri TaxID=433720 RepID=A0A815PNF0_9BILA|nr:unnamed protein product [Adineta steineri]
MDSLGEENMITSWTSSSDDTNPESISTSAAADKNQHEKINIEQEHLSSEGSIFSDSDIQQQDETNTSPSVNFERGPSFFTPNV